MYIYIISSGMTRILGPKMYICIWP